MDEQRARLERLSRNFEHLAARVATLSSPVAAGTAFGRPRVAVVGWDLTHNPAGRSFVLYRLLERDWDVQLIGPAWPRFGEALWQPLRDEGLAHRILPVRSLPELWREGTVLALAAGFDLVIVCKPRLPGLLLGLLLAEQSRCPLLFDFDEDERAFGDRGGAESLLEAPFGAAGTELASHYWSVADCVTVASRALQQNLGGHLVRHARDERAALPDRSLARQRLGFTPDDVVLAFLGTVRPHKGLASVLAAIDAVGDPRLKLLVAGTIADPAMQQALRARQDGRVVLRESFAFGAIGDYVAAADLVPLLQDPEAAITQSQLPAKLTDALQHGVRVVATPTPPLQELAALGIDMLPAEGFAAYLRERLASPETEASRARQRRLFEGEFGFAVNRVRLAAAIAEARWRSNPFASTVRDVLQALRTTTRRAIAAGQARPLAPHAAARAAPGGRFDVAFFWKQNDSDLFGRRADMVVKHLLASGRVGRVVHFDQPVALAGLREMARAAIGASAHVAALQARSTVARALGLADEPALLRRLLVTHEGEAANSLGGRSLGARPDAAGFVAAALREAGLDPRRTLAWFCPVIWDAAEILRSVPFLAVVADLIDDERAWPTTPERLQKLESAYRAVLQAADVVFTNGEGNRARFAALRPDIVVVPNGAELSAPSAAAAPPALAALPRPWIGYVGNLNDRIDWALLRELAQLRPLWSLVLIGPYTRDRIPPEMRALANVHFTGAMPYDAARAAMRAFDAAIVPHTCDALTASMNPLKVYNYLAAGVQVVSVPLANLEDVRDLLRIAPSAEGFAAAIDRILAGLRPEAPAQARLDAIAWPGRVAAMLAQIDVALQRRLVFAAAD